MHSFLYSVIFAPVIEVLSLKNSITFALLAVLLSLALWKYWSFTRIYADFPSFPLLRYFVYCIVFRKIPKHLPFTSFAFKKLLSTLEEFQNEGLCLMWIGKPFLFIFNEEASKIFSNDPNAVDKSYKYEVLQDAFGTGLITSNGDTWRKHRKMINPVFHTGELKNKLPIFNKYAEILVKKLSKVENETFIDALEYLKPCSFNIICESIIGLKVDNKENKEIAKRIMNLTDEIAELSTYRVAIPWFHYKFMLNFMPSGRKYLRMYEEGTEIFKKVVYDMKESVLSETSIESDSKMEKAPKSKSFAYILMEHHLKDPSFTMEDVRSEVITFTAAGYDSIAHAVMYCLFLLGIHLDVQDQVYNEVESISAKDITHDDLNKLRYMNCVIKETLRLFPILPFHGRCTNKDIQCGKYLVPKGTDIFFSPYMLHRDPKIYPDPETFNPDRFQEGNSGKRPWIHTPFSEGFRNCIGKKFAMMEIMVILTHILQNFRVTSLDKREDLDLCMNIIITPSKPLKMKFSARK